MSDRPSPADLVDTTLRGAYTFGALLDELMDLRKEDDYTLVRLEVSVSIPPRNREMR